MPHRSEWDSLTRDPCAVISVRPLGSKLGQKRAAWRSDNNVHTLISHTAAACAIRLWTNCLFSPFLRITHRHHYALFWIMILFGLTKLCIRLLDCCFIYPKFETRISYWAVDWRLLNHSDDWRRPTFICYSDTGKNSKSNRNEKRFLAFCLFSAFVIDPKVCLTQTPRKKKGKKVWELWSFSGPLQLFGPVSFSLYFILFYFFLFQN